MAGKTGHQADTEKKRKRADTHEKDRNAKRHRQQEQANKKAAKIVSDAAELKDKALKVLHGMNAEIPAEALANGENAFVGQAEILDKQWALSAPVGGRIADIDPIFSVDEKHLIVTQNTSLQVYSVADSHLVRQISLPIATKGKDGQNRITAAIVATWLSPNEPNFVWIACSDGRVWKVDWRHGSAPEDTLTVKSDNIQDMAVCSMKLGKSFVDVLYISEAKKQECTITAYYRLKRSQLNSVVYKSQHADQRIHLVRATSDGKYVVGASAESIIVGVVQPGEGNVLESEFYSFDTPDLVCALDLRVSPKSSAALTPKKQSKKSALFDVVDLIIGCARGGMLVYNDVINTANAVRGAKAKPKKEEIQARKFHWHRRAVHSLKWSRDGNYMISGGSENTLVLWQVDTGKTTHLPHLSGSVENIVVSPSGSSYGVHLDDNSVMILTTSEMKPTFYISGIQTAARYFAPPKDSLVMRLADAVKEVRNPVPAAVNPRVPSQLHICVGAGQQAVMSGSQQSAPILQSFDLDTLRSQSRQALARTQPTDVNITSKGNPISEPTVTHLAFSSNGKYMASVDDWQPPMRDIENMSAETRQRFLRDRREIFLKFWTVGEEGEQLALTSRINSPHATSRPEPVLALVADPKSSKFATLGDDGLVKIWSFKTRQFDGVTSKDDKGETLQTWSCAHTISLGGHVGADVLVTLDGNKAGVRSGAMCYSSDGSTLFVAFGAEHDGGVHAIDTRTGKVKLAMRGLWRGKIRHIEALSSLVITLSDDLRVYDVITEETMFGIKLPKFADPALSRFAHLALDRRSNTIAVVAPGKYSSDILVFDPEENKALCVDKIPHRVISLVSSPDSTGYIAVDDAAQLWTISRTSDEHAISIARPLEELRLADIVVDENELAGGITLLDGDDDEASEDEGETNGERMDVDEEDDETHAAVISRQKLAELFDTGPAFTMPAVEELFAKFTDLLALKPLPSSSGRLRVRAPGVNICSYPGFVWYIVQGIDFIIEHCISSG
ncbi:sporulation protein, partial [Plectosphaerella plurivora]